MPGFMGTNPAIVPNGPQKGKQVLKQESDIAYELLQSFTPEQLQQAKHIRYHWLEPEYFLTNSSLE